MQNQNAQANSPAPAAKFRTSRPDTQAAIDQLRKEGQEAHQALLNRYRPSSTPFFRKRTDAEIEQANRKAEEERRLAAIVDAKRGGKVPLKYRSAKISDLTQLPADSRDSYSRAIDLCGLAMARPMIVGLIGEIGGGKTHMACAIVNEMISQGRKARYVTAMDYILEIKRTFNKGDQLAVEADYAQPDLLAVDELQMRGETAYEDNLLMCLIDKRYRSERSTLLLANHRTKQEFLDRLDARTASRMIEAGGIFVVDWPDLRGRLS